MLSARGLIVGVAGRTVTLRFWMEFIACVTALSGITLIRFTRKTLNRSILPIHVTVFSVAVLGLLFVDIPPGSGPPRTTEVTARPAPQAHQRLAIEGTWKGNGTAADHDGLLGPRRSQPPAVLKTTGVFIIRSRGASILGTETNDKGLSIDAKLEPILKVSLGEGTTSNLQPDGSGAYTSHIVFKGGFPAPEIERMAERIRGNPAPELSDDVEWDTKLEALGNTAKLRFVMSEFRTGTRRMSNQRVIVYALEKTSDDVPDLFATPPPPPPPPSTPGKGR